MMSDAGMKSSAKEFKHDMDEFKAHIEADFAAHPDDGLTMAQIAEADVGAAARASLMA
jgi:hypothetical protein